MISMKELEMTEDLLVDELKKVVKKGELKDANEAKALKDVLESIKIIHCIMEGGENKEMSDGYSQYSRSYGHMHNRIPSSTTYGGTMNFDGVYGRRMPGYYGHSIKDRMIASLETLYDEAGTQHEKTMIDNWIGRIKAEN